MPESGIVFKNGTEVGLGHFTLAALPGYTGVSSSGCASDPPA